MQLSATEYGNFLANESPPISTATISEKATQLLVEQFDYIRTNAVYPLDKFLEYITCAANSHVPLAPTRLGTFIFADMAI